jgi:hypothetical protein
MRLSDAGLHQPRTKALYPNHRLPPWPTEVATPRSLEPIVRRRGMNRPPFAVQPAPQGSKHTSRPDFWQPLERLLATYAQWREFSCLPLQERAVPSRRAPAPPVVTGLHHQFGQIFAGQDRTQHASISPACAMRARRRIYPGDLQLGPTRGHGSLRNALSKAVRCGYPRGASKSHSRRLTMRLSDAGLRQRQTKLIYPNHRLPPWLTGPTASRSLEPIVRRCYHRPSL